MAVAVGLPVALAAQNPIAAWRAAHERQIVDELMAFVALPNVAGNDADMRKNAEFAAAASPPSRNGRRRPPSRRPAATWRR